MAKHLTRTLLKTLQTSWLLVAVGMAAAACSHTAGTDPEGNDEISGDESSFEGASKPENLTVQEHATYQSDWAYVSKLAPNNTSVILNHADERQHRFVEMRLKLAGKTRENSPQLFKRIDETRALHLAQGLKPGQFVPRPHGELARNVDLGRVPQHYMTSTNILSSTSMEAIATGSRTEALTYGYIDSGTWDDNGAPLGNMGYAEVYTNMPYKSVRTTGNLALTTLPKVVGDSMLIMDTLAGGHFEFYAMDRNNNGPSWSTPTILEPVDHNSDSCYSICLNRTWTNDCDIDLTGSQQALKVPIKGSISLTGNTYKLDSDKIQAYKDGNAKFDDNAPDPGGSLRVLLKSDGGGCATSGGSNYTVDMQAFWKTVTLTNDSGGAPVTLSWDMTGANVATFNNSCRMVQDSLQLDLSITVPWVYRSSGFKGYTSRAISSVSGGSLLTCIRETNSCLAAGTQIEMADGAQKPIESIHDGDLVLTPNAQGDLGLSISDTAKGIETVPMVRIEDERGHSLLMTEMHPIQVVGRGMVMAKYLQTGDVVQTKEGPSHLVKVARESYDGAVHNLKVGNAAEVQNLGQDQTVVYANGFLVGDGQIQSKYESLEEQAKAHPARVSVPARWRADRLNSKKHH